MTGRSGRPGASYLEVAGVWPPTAYRVRSVAAVVLAICPPIVCAWLAENSDRWDLFERSGSITAAIGLVIASRRYIEFGAFELATARTNKQMESELKEILEDIFTAKLGLALSAFGTIVWGWGTYLGWWSFGLLAAWALFAIFEGRRDWKRSRPV